MPRQGNSSVTPVFEPRNERPKKIVFLSLSKDNFFTPFSGFTQAGVPRAKARGNGFETNSVAPGFSRKIQLPLIKRPKTRLHGVNPTPRADARGNGFENPSVAPGFSPEFQSNQEDGALAP